MTKMNDGNGSNEMSGTDGSDASNGNSSTSGLIIAIVISIVAVGVILWIVNRGGFDETSQQTVLTDATTMSVEIATLEQPVSDSATDETTVIDPVQEEMPSDTAAADVPPSNGESADGGQAIAEDAAPVTESDVATNSAEGIVTYKSDDLHGQMTASGEPYDKDALVAAHKDLPFGTVVTVVNLYNEKSVVVEIVDRMPPTVSALIDVSSAAAREIDMIDAGMVDGYIEW